ncbi:hypothetical protein ACTFIR_004879 [Dictyostelium discoideum]
MVPYGPMILQYIGKGERQSGRGLYERGYVELTNGKRFWGTDMAIPPSMANAQIIMFLRNFEPPKAFQMEAWFLSVFGCPINSIIEGGLARTASGYGVGAWDNFYNTAQRLDVVDYILTETLTTPADFLDHPNYPQDGYDQDSLEKPLDDESSCSQKESNINSDDDDYDNDISQTKESNLSYLYSQN